MLKLVYGDAAVTMKMVYKWFEWFRNGCESVEDKERSGHFNILTIDLNMRWVSAKFVPHVLMVKQKQQHLSISLELRDHAASDSSFLENVITEDET